MSTTGVEENMEFPQSEFNINIMELSREKSMLHQIKEELEAENSPRSTMINKIFMGRNDVDSQN
jgi:hypothetical protein